MSVRVGGGQGVIAPNSYLSRFLSFRFVTCLNDGNDQHTLSLCQSAVDPSLLQDRTKNAFKLSQVSLFRPSTWDMKTVHTETRDLIIHGESQVRQHANSELL